LQVGREAGRGEGDETRRAYKDTAVSVCHESPKREYEKEKGFSRRGKPTPFTGVRRKGRII